MEPKLLTADRFVDKQTGFLYRYVKSDTEFFRPHYHDYCEIFLMLDGTAEHSVNGTIQLLRPRDLVFIRPADVHDYRSIGKPFSMLNLTFTMQTLEAMFAYLGPGFPRKELTESALPPTVALTAAEFSALQAQMNSIAALPPENPEAAATALRVLLFTVFTKYFDAKTFPKSKEIPPWLEELCAEIRRSGNFIEGSERFFSLTDKSREHVSRCMKQYMGLTVTEFINGLRVNYIANMLKNSNHSITDIIYSSGFNNVSWANSCFKQEFGVSMREFRKK